jgi:hypothetical protein
MQKGIGSTHFYSYCVCRVLEALYLINLITCCLCCYALSNSSNLQLKLLAKGSVCRRLSSSFQREKSRLIGDYYKLHYVVFFFPGFVLQRSVLRVM